jgi:hypothetical protein
MKLNIFKSGLLIALMSIFTGCTDSDKPFTTGAPEIQTYELTTTKTVAALKAMATGTATEYTADDVIEAYVTSNDAAGNFYKSISFQDVPTTSGTPIGFSISVNKSMTFADGFYPGRKVYIKLKGLYFGNLYGSLKIGSNSALDGIEPLDYQKYLFPSATVLNEEDLVRHVTLASARLDVNQNTLIEISNVQFADSSIGRTYFDIDSGGYATNQTIEDPNVGTISICRISQYAPFSVGKIPSGKGSIRGVMTKYNTDYQYMVRSESDFKLTGTRATTLFNEGFNTNAGSWTSFSVVGTEVWTYSATFGNPGGMMKMSGFATTNKANDDWLISPAQNFSALTSASLSFDNAYKFTGNPIEVKISNNYSGTGSPVAAGVTWTTLTGATLSAGNYVYANSGSLSLASFIGAGNNNIHIAFRYTSTTAAASTWEVDNIKIIGN